MTRSIAATALLLVLVTGSPIRADGPRATWKNYVLAVGKREGLDILACYTKDYRDRISTNERLMEDHFREMFGLLQRDYEVRVIAVEARGPNRVLKARFKEKANEENSFEQEIVFSREGSKWLICRAPELPYEPNYWRQRLASLSTASWLGLGAAIVLTLFLIRRLLSHDT